MIVEHFPVARSFLQMASARYTIQAAFRMYYRQLKDEVRSTRPPGIPMRHKAPPSASHSDRLCFPTLLVWTCSGFLMT